LPSVSPANLLAPIFLRIVRRFARLPRSVRCGRAASPAAPPTRRYPSARCSHRRTRRKAGRRGHTARTGSQALAPRPGPRPAELLRRENANQCRFGDAAASGAREAMRQFRIADGAIEEPVSDLQTMLARIRPLCLCKEPGLPMYIAEVGGLVPRRGARRTRWRATWRARSRRIVLLHRLKRAVWGARFDPSQSACERRQKAPSRIPANSCPDVPDERHCTRRDQCQQQDLS
jgi:hypothetical protein